MTENEGFTRASNAIRDEIDAQVLLDLMVALNGWHRVEIGINPPSTGIVSSMLSWCQDNTTGEWKSSSFGRTWVFENEQDAMLFSLRWS